jgi:hypothetical protein
VTIKHRRAVASVALFVGEDANGLRKFGKKLFGALAYWPAVVVIVGSACTTLIWAAALAWLLFRALGVV